MKFISYKNKHKGKTIHVLGASEMMNHIAPDFFNDRITIGCNFVYRTFSVRYTITRHIKVVRAIKEESTTLFRPDVTTDLGGIKITNMPGITFDNQELFWSRSIAPTAVDLARYLGARQIVVWGVECSNNYMQGYTQMKDPLLAKIFSETNRQNMTEVIRKCNGLGIEVVWL